MFRFWHWLGIVKAKKYLILSKGTGVFLLYRSENIQFLLSPSVFSTVDLYYSSVCPPFFVCLSHSSSESAFRCSSKNMDYWPVPFWVLTDLYLILYHFIFTHLPASQVAGAMDPLWLSQRTYWSCVVQPLPLCFAYRIHRQTYKDAIEVKESSQSALTRTHKHMWVSSLVTSEVLQMRF